MIMQKTKHGQLDPGTSLVLILFFAMFLYAGLQVLLDGSTRLTRNIHLVRSGISCSGTVIDYKMSPGGKNRRIWPVVSFTAPNGNVIQFESLAHFNYSGYSAMQTVPVIFDPNNPNIAEINESDRLWGGLLTRFILGSFFSMLGGGVILWVLNENFRKSI